MQALDQQHQTTVVPDLERTARVDERGLLALGSTRLFAAGQQLLANGGPPSHAALITGGLVKVTAAGPDPVISTECVLT